jgi:hypothetical protein
MLKRHGRPVQHTTHEHKTEDTHLESFFLVTMNHAGRPVRTHAHTRILQTHACNYEMQSQAFWKTHTTLSFHTHRHTRSHIFEDNQVHTQAGSNTHTHTYFPFCDAGMHRKACSNKLTHIHTRTHHTQTQHTYAHTYAQMQRALCS